MLDQINAPINNVDELDFDVMADRLLADPSLDSILVTLE